MISSGYTAGLATMWNAVEATTAQPPTREPAMAAAPGGDAQRD